MRILLISPNILTSPYPVYPIGLDYVAGSVPREHEVRIGDMNIISREELAVILNEYDPEVIGLSCRNIDNTDAGDPQLFIDEYRKLVEWLRQRTGAIIVCGGSGFTIMPDRIFAELGVDYGVIGEGERFGLLVDALRNGREPDQVPGVITSPGAEVLPPPWGGKRIRQFRTDAAHLQFYLDLGGMLKLQTKRGCSFNCIYCSYPHIEGRKHRLIPPDEVARTALELQEGGAGYFFVTDSAFNSDIAHSLAVARAFKDAGVTIPWGGFFAPLKLPDDYFSVMADAGLCHVEFGTESMSAAMLKTYRKPFTVADVLAAHRQARAAGLHTAHYLLMGGPGETAATVSDSLDSLANLESLERTVFFFFIGIRIYPRTALYDIALAEGSINAGMDLLEPVYYQSDGIDRQGIEAMIAARADGRMNWVFGAGGVKGAATIRKLHTLGYVGPLWDYLVY